MKVNDISWKLDSMADATFLDAEARKSAKDAAYFLRELSARLGEGSEATVHDLLHAVHTLEMDRDEWKYKAENL